MLGILLRDGNIEASIDPEGTIELSGRVVSGEGQLDLRGGGRLDGTLDVTVTGKDFVAANIPAAYVIVAPELAVSRVAERITITGGVRVPRASIDLTKLPQGSGGQAVSSDVVVIDDESPVVQSRKTPVFAEVTVQLGKDVKLTGFGLEATLGGQLLVTERPGSETVGAGEVLVEGTYKAWGQNLTIERGRLMYASSPLNNPQLDIVANRKADEVTARLNVTGTAQRPVLNVSADPAMAQTEALSYLLTGRPMTQLGQGEGDMMQSASQSLQGAAGNLLAKSIGKRLGIDEIGVEQSAEIGGSAFTIGEYLSPRLYLSYGVGLFEPGQVVTLRYELSSNISVEASQGPLNQRAGINYRIEK
jgi:translocation and assembly module TamB